MYFHSVTTTGADLKPRATHEKMADINRFTSLIFKVDVEVATAATGKLTAATIQFFLGNKKIFCPISTSNSILLFSSCAAYSVGILFLNYVNLSLGGKRHVE
eukprot:TRINITY_DN1583_c0_g1_i9.p2 TRINITY_DN1583_c0_g1~~TRINITY_DN1583_c0_g1_i9.p2  ORF type:complete len:102 (+),score=12.23 TRINITY_DN1583_c0_g1_i9:464-769(+)